MKIKTKVKIKFLSLVLVLVMSLHGLINAEDHGSRDYVDVEVDITLEGNVKDEKASNEIVNVETQTRETLDEATKAEEKHVVRCRSCGHRITTTKDYWSASSNLLQYAEKSRHEPTLGKKAKTHIFTNPAKQDLEIAAFEDATADASSESSTTASFYSGYAWRTAYCPRCKAQIGFFYVHEHVEKCMQEAPEKEKEEVSSFMDENVETIVDTALHNRCLHMRRGWWTFRFCYKAEVEQYHEEEDGSKSHNWSMGKFIHAEVVEPEKAKEQVNSVKHLQHQYRGGQKCDENNLQRSSDAAFICCREFHKGVHIHSLEEPSTCFYLITICVPQLCAGYKASKESSSPEPSQEKQMCNAKFKKVHGQDQLPEFYGILWPSVVAEGGRELAWTKELKITTAINR